MVGPLHLLPVTLRNKSQLFYQQKWIYLGIAENCNSGQERYGKTISTVNEEEERYLTEKKEEVSRSCFEGKCIREKPAVSG